MCIGGSLQVSHKLVLFSICGRTEKFKNLEIRSRGYVTSSLLSLGNLRKNGWSPHLPNKPWQQSRYLPHKHNYFSFQAFARTGSTDIPFLELAGSSLSRLCSALRGSPLFLQLVQASGIIAFAVWGLGPLMRHSRNLFLHQYDSSWKKSRSYVIFSSYLQPVLLWTGAILICRAFEPVAMPSETSQAVKQRLLNFIRSLSSVLAFAYCLSSLIQQLQKFFLESKGTADARNMGFQFAGKAVYTAVWVAALSLFMELLGFSTRKWITAGGLGTVLLTLAGREILTNFLSSIMIHATRPFVLNEWIQTKIEGYEVSGNVEHVGWWSPTIIRGEDREAVHIPNHQFTVNVVRNLSQKTHWRIKAHLAISHLDVNKIKNIIADMRKILAKHPQVEQQRLHRRVFLDNIAPENQALLIFVSCFVKTSHVEEYLCVKESILLDLLRVISHHNARLATPIRTLLRTYSDGGGENLSYSETIARRPLLMLESSHRINGDNKAKTCIAPSSDEDQTSKSASPEITPADKLQEQKQKSGDNLSKTGKDGSSTSKQSSSISEEHSVAVQIEGISAKINDNSASEKPHDPSSSVVKPIMEENIVLGMAIEGSKRILPLEQERRSVAIDGAEAVLMKEKGLHEESHSQLDDKK